MTENNQWIKDAAELAVDAINTGDKDEYQRIMDAAAARAKREGEERGRN